MDSVGPHTKRPAGDCDWPAFRTEVARAAAEILRAGTGATVQEQAARTVQEQAEGFLAAHRRPGSLVACGPGCGHCCVVNVAVLEPEAHAVAAFLHANRSTDELDALRRRLEELTRANRWLDDEERLMLRRPCAFLDAGASCSIHPVRPLLCRQVTSVNPEDCRDAVARHAFGETVPVLADLFHRQVFEEAFLALGQSLEELGRNARSGRLSDTVLKLLS